jgi:hypothetical protein
MKDGKRMRNRKSAIENFSAKVPFASLKRGRGNVMG